MKTKKEFMDFLDTYKVLFSLNENESWVDRTYHEDTLLLKYKNNRRISTLCSYENDYISMIHILVSANNAFATINMVSNFETTNHVIENLNEEIKKQYSNLFNHKFKYFNKFGGCEIIIKDNYQTIANLLQFSLNSIDKLLIKKHYR